MNGRQPFGRGLLNFLRGLEQTSDPQLKAARPTLLFLAIFLPVFSIGLIAFGIFFVGLGFRIDRVALGLVIGLAFGVLGLGTLTFAVVTLRVMDRRLGAGTAAELAALGHTLSLREPQVAPPPAIDVPLPFSLGSWRQRISVTPDGSIQLARLLMPARSVPASAVRQVALRRIILFNRWRNDLPRLLLIDDDGHCLLRMNAVGMSYQDACRLAAALRVPIDINWEQERTSGWLAREFPGSTTSLEAHPIRAFGLAVLAITIGLAVALLIGRG